ncbi:SMC family ATPase [Leptolyngbya sp. FACHB-541]|uniref:AAA family ATPase n=1 Tax=Leptolyngbya sp. FACHB-541 TaxID=2692810 RepID=UPI001687A06D|nr:SMC family ATPase [Leptolyngbya sp. FACHB-541]MBD1999498.1 SMC family ATPase [Leptolyngbya sp. FACHB-541]
MEILSVTLKNFKSHSDRHFQFQPGTNAICGENGAGKTSILEAIAWTLFNYRGSYKNEDLIRNGANSAQATVAFVSSRDTRTYEVQRCTTKGYTLYDPQLGQRLDYKHIEEEVMPWMRQHLGVAPGTDLGRLFANTIGVPQGTFTADFLQTAEKRKPIFDAVLKVEEYRQTNQQMLSLEKYGKAEVERLEGAIAQYEDSLKDWKTLQQRRQEISQEIATAEAALRQLQTDLAKLQVEKDALAAQARQVQQLEGQLHKLDAQLESKQQANWLLQQSVERSQQAVQTCELSREGYQVFLQAETALRELDQQGRNRQNLIKQRDAQQKMLLDQQTELTRLTVQLENLKQAELEAEQLQPLIQQQLDLEQQQTTTVELLQRLQASETEAKNLTKQWTKIQSSLERLTQEIVQIQALETALRQIPELEQRRDRLQERLSRIAAAKQFEAAMRQLITVGTEKGDRHQLQAEEALSTLAQMQQIVPLLATASVDAALDAIRAGVELNDELLDALQRILADLEQQTSLPQLEQQLRDVRKQLDEIYRRQAEFATLEARLAQQSQWQEEAEQVHSRISQLQTQLTAEPALKQQRSQLAAKLEQLGDPRGRSQLLARQLQQQSQIQSAFAQLQQAQAGIQQKIADLEVTINQFAELDEQLDQQKQLRQTHQPAYLTYLQHQKDAETLPALQAELEGAIAQLQTLETEQVALKTNYDQTIQTYDPEQWQQVEAVYNTTRSQADQIMGGLPQQRKLLDELDHQLTTLRALAEKRDRAQIDLKQRERIRRFITFARKVYKEAGPRITERYVQSVSQEADKLFRELMNRQNVALEWTRDYEIMVQEGAFSRRFINLSGGEQMCAALAVRLALLRVLADIDIAFFDEPTTNMDRPRRASLAEAIANIKTFRQLFVISHDDTFEQVTENVILVERE